MVVCVEAGLGLDQAMRKVAEEMKKTYRVLAEEFALANFQLQMGRPRSEVLHELGARTGVSDLRALAAVLIQADKFGSSVAQALRTQSDSMRIRRRQLAEEKAAEDGREADLPAGAVHLSRHFRDPGRPGRHHHGPPDVPHDGRWPLTSPAPRLHNERQPLQQTCPTSSRPHGRQTAAARRS